LEAPDLGNEDGVMGSERTPGAPTTKRYTPEGQAREVRMVRQLRKELGASHGTIQRVADMVLDALEMARSSRGRRRLVGLVAYADAGSQFTSVRFTERLEEIGARPSIGTVADSYDNALAETTNGLYKTAWLYGPDAPRPWDDVDELELATLSWVHWFNEQQLDGHCGDVPSAEFEAAFYAAQQTDPEGVGTRQPEPPSNPGRFIPGISVRLGEGQELGDRLPVGLDGSRASTRHTHRSGSSPVQGRRCRPARVIPLVAMKLPRCQRRPGTRRCRSAVRVVCEVV